jgi:hypothetical protein
MRKQVTNVRAFSHPTVDGQGIRARVLAPGGMWSMAIDDRCKARGNDDRWVDLGSGDDLRGLNLEVHAELHDPAPDHPDRSPLALTVEIDGPTLTSVVVANEEAAERATYAAIVIFA